MKIIISPHLSVILLLTSNVIWLILFFFFFLRIGPHAVKENIFSVYIKALSFISGFWLILNKFTRGLSSGNNDEVSQHKCNLSGCHSSNSSLLQNFPLDLQNPYVKLRIFPSDQNSEMQLCIMLTSPGRLLDHTRMH